METIEAAVAALDAVGRSDTAQEKLLHLATLRECTFTAYNELAADLDANKRRQRQLNQLRQKLQRLNRLKKSNSVDISRLKGLAGNSDDKEASEPRLVGLFSEYGLSANETNARDVINDEFEARKAAATNNALLESRAHQMDAAIQRLREFLSSKWPQVRSRFDEMLETTAKLESVYSEVNEEIEMARNGTAQRVERSDDRRKFKRRRRDDDDRDVRKRRRRY